MEIRSDDALPPDLFSDVPVAIAYLDLDFRIQWANKAYQNSCGLSMAQLSGKTCYSHQGRPHPCRRCPARVAMSTGRPAEAEIPFLNRDSLTVHVSPVRDGKNNIVGLVRTGIGAAERGKNGTALQQSLDTLNETQRLARIGSWELDLKTGRLVWSDEIYRIFEIEPAQFEASYDAFLHCVHPDDRDRVDRAYQESVETGEPYAIEHRLLLAKDRIKYVHDRCETHYDKEGNPVRSIGTVQDITSRKQVEEENKKLRTQYEQAQRLESIGRLAGGVAHDFNNMLMVILGRVDLALYKMDDENPVCATLEEIRSAAQSSANLTRQLLAFARRQPIDPRILDLNDAVQDTLKMLGRLIGEEIALAWMPGDNPGLVKIDPAQVDQILVNLCVNARDAIGGIGKITIETKPMAFDDAYCAMHVGFSPGDYVMLGVSDNGCGMAPETAGRVFEPFFTTKAAGKGTGLGLATVYGIVRQNNGFINVYSEPDMGTTINVYLPRQGSAAVVQPEKTAMKAPKGRGETVLFVEDEAMILDIGKEALEMLGYKVLTADTPGKALRLAESTDDPIDLLVTDVVMPEMTARELSQRVKARHPQTGVLYISGYSANIIAQHGVLREDAIFLQKPFSTTELALKVKKSIEQAKTNR